MSARAGLATALAAAVAVIAAPAGPAAACGGGGSSGGSSSGGSSSSGSDSSYSDYAASSDDAPPCIDETDVHGYRSCTGYGTWARRLPSMSFELTTTTGWVDLSGISIDGSIDHGAGTSYSYRVVGDDLGRGAPTMGLAVRLIGHRRWLHTGVEMGAAGIAAEGAPTMALDGRASLTPRASLVLTGGAVAGARGFVGRVSLGGEVMGGVRAIGVTAESQSGACVETDTHLTATPAVELRARADLWLSPWLSAGAFLGRDVLTRNTSGGLVLAAHMTAFDGGR